MEVYEYISIRQPPSFFQFPHFSKIQVPLLPFRNLINVIYLRFP
jgi:hypothetical protein